MEERRHAEERERTIAPAPQPEADLELADDRLTADAATAYGMAAEGPGTDVLGEDAGLALQQTVGNEAMGSLLAGQPANPVLPVIAQAGSPLDAGIRSEMEAQFGADFGGVRVHSGAEAARSAADLSAVAYTTGENIVLGQGVDAGSDAGRHTIAHELTHVLQQRDGPVAGTEREDGLSVSDPSDAFEQAASRTAHEMAGLRTATQPDSRAGVGGD